VPKGPKGEKLSANPAEDSSSLQRGILYGGLASREETGDRPLMDSNSATFKKMLQRAKERGYVTYDELNQFLPQDKLSSEQIEDSMAALSEMGITVIENEEPDDTSNEEEEETPVRPTGNLDDEDIGRTDDPVRMYLREMGSVELLSREGEIAIAKRIEAGREKMIGGICESPLTIRALLAWRAALLEGKILLRDIIDLDATYDSDPTEAEMAEAVAEVETEDGAPEASENKAAAETGRGSGNGADRATVASSEDRADRLPPWNRCCCRRWSRPSTRSRLHTRSCRGRRTSGWATCRRANRARSRVKSAMRSSSTN
jgi:hypothetical protein